SLIALAGLSVGAWALSVAGEAPDIDSITPIEQGENSFVYAADGTRLGSISSSIIRKEVPLEKIPDSVQQATIAIEDANFYEHSGVDFGAVARAAVANAEAGEVEQGGSTITQQLVKNRYTGQLDERDLEAKIQEAKLAEGLEEELSKDEILEEYLNTASYGTNGGSTSIGIEAAAQQYFGKRAIKLDVKESALLAGLPQAPSEHNPLLNHEGAKERRADVLDAMAREGYISNQQAKRLAGGGLGVNPTKKYDNIKEPYFFDYVTDQLLEEYGTETVREGGLKVYTTIDLEKQKQARQAIDGRLNLVGDPSSAVVTIDPKNGDVLAMVSNAQYEDRKFNLAAQGQRQPGSSFKTMVLMAAVARGVDPDSTTYTSRSPIILNSPLLSEPWEVSTFDDSSRGTQTLRAATLASDNSIYAQLTLDVGPEAVVETAEKLGITSDLDPNPAIGIGGLTNGVTPLEMANAYATLANGGTRHDATVIKQVKFPNGKTKKFGKQKSKQVFTDGEVAEVTSILEANVQGGTGTAAQTIGCPAAGKTGTTDEFKDAWFVGYTPDLATSVWVGFPDEARSMEGVHGINVAGGTFPAQIWGDYMAQAKESCKGFSKPSTPFQPTPFYGEFSTGKGSVKSGDGDDDEDSFGGSSTSDPSKFGAGSSDDDFDSDAYAPGVQDGSDIPGGGN
ncbi:MAG: transglycosylase domain-containing protein, partial [Solirubrobacterales bacterium]